MTEKEMAVLSKVYEEFLRLRFRMEEWMRDEELIKWDKDVPGLPGATLESRDNILYFRIPDVPPSRNKLSLRMLHRVKREWAERIAYAFYSQHFPVCPQYTKVLAIIRVHKNTSDFWDTDQLMVDGIINGLRATKIFGDDNFHNLAYMVIGEWCQEMPYTEVIVTEMPSLDHLIGYKVFQNGPQKPASK